MIIRAALPIDEDDLLVWRNDPVSRSMSISNDMVRPQDHALWFSRSLNDPGRVLLIGDKDDLKIGVCRFDIEMSGKAEVSLNLNPQARGKGLAAPFLSASITIFRQSHESTITATIRHQNAASLRCFSICGFVATGSDAEFHYFELA